MIKHFCDRCGKEIIGCAFEINALVVPDSAITKAFRAIAEAFPHKDREYCASCAQGVVNYLKGADQNG